ncbi:MAG: hypothetical protein ACK59Y_07635 [Betaproteobacteria bacterium]|jgi:hypothetical protein|nr:hypothetical protein [Betaproteobacteria bacterium]
MISNTHYESKSRKKIELSKHAGKRTQQRAIPQDCIPLILAYGERSFDGNGAVRYLLTKQSMAVIGRVMGRSARFDAMVGRYVVVDATDESKVITVAHLHASTKQRDHK